MVKFHEYLEALKPRITDELMISNISGVSREWNHINDREGNLYQVPMAGSTPMALGLALALPHRKVIAMDADGSTLMGLSSLPMVAQKNPSNLIIIVCDNECYEAAGRIPTFTSGTTDLSGMAREAGIANTALVRNVPEFLDAINKAFKARGTNFIVVKCEPGHLRVPFTLLRCSENKLRFIRYIEKTENIQVIRPVTMKL